MRRAVPLLVVLSVSTLAAPGRAQTCLGTASFGMGHVQLGGTSLGATGQGSAALGPAAGTRGILGGLSVAIDHFTRGLPFPEGYALEGGRAGRLSASVGPAPGVLPARELPGPIRSPRTSALRLPHRLPTSWNPLVRV